MYFANISDKLITKHIRNTNTQLNYFFCSDKQSNNHGHHNMQSIVNEDPKKLETKTMMHCVIALERYFSCYDSIVLEQKAMKVNPTTCD